MLDIDNITGIIFDYGGTIDSNGKHWAEVLCEAYQQNKVPVTREQFREAYVYGERYLATHIIILPEDNFHVLLQKKVSLQLGYLVEKGWLTDKQSDTYIVSVCQQCYTFAQALILKEKAVLDELHRKYPMVLVSNFYGNVNAVLKDFGIFDCFDSIVESAVVGIRKPDPGIFALGVKELNQPAEKVVVIGDSHAKDIVPATTIGCKTIWLKGTGWEKDDKNATADVIIEDFMALKDIFHLSIK